MTDNINNLNLKSPDLENAKYIHDNNSQPFSELAKKDQPIEDINQYELEKKEILNTLHSWILQIEKMTETPDHFQNVFTSQNQLSIIQFLLQKNSKTEDLIDKQSININELKTTILKLSKNLKHSVSLYHSSQISEINKKNLTIKNETENKTILEIIEIKDRLLILDNNIKKYFAFQYFRLKKITKKQCLKLAWYSFVELIAPREIDSSFINKIFDKSDELIVLLQSIEFIIGHLNDKLNKYNISDSCKCLEYFDPHTMKALAFVNNPEHEDNVIVEIFKQGYIRHDKIIRVAEVKINRRKNEQ